MLARLTLLAFLAALAFTGCKTPYKESDKKRKEQKQDASKDPAFQAFLGRLRIAAEKRDYEMMKSLMVPDFGYRWDNPPPGDSVFAFWDLNNLWLDLNSLLKKEFVPHDDFMVSPPELATNPDYAGYRIGIKQVMGSWRFIYFVPAPPPDQTPPQ
ncbi:MAG: hypothetical protein ABMA13_08430 [Chthoniobacteraceae bacterium]